MSQQKEVNPFRSAGPFDRGGGEIDGCRSGERGERVKFKRKVRLHRSVVLIYLESVEKLEGELMGGGRATGEGEAVKENGDLYLIMDRRIQTYNKVKLSFNSSSFKRRACR